ncbi:MAG: hypothetical protein WDO74_14250 [Pseudomonadota bacterium]
MVHSSSLSSARSIFAPVFIATVSLCSLAQAQAPSETQPNSPAPASTASEAPTVSEAAPVPPPVLVAPPSVIDQPKLRLPRVHEGFYLRFTSGPSFLTLRGHNPSGASASITDSGVGGSIAIGGAIMPGLVLAGTLSGTAFNAEFKGGPFVDATVSANGVTRQASRNAEGGFGMIGLLVDWYPQPRGGWHTGFSTGLGGVGLTNSADDSALGGVNFAGSVFGGYDWALGRNWALGLQLTASGGTSSKLQTDFDSDDSHDSGYRLAPFSIGVQASVLYF